MLRSFDGTEPTVHEDAFVHPQATVIGDVVVEADASVWPNVTLRGDHGRIAVREGANVQDNAVCHEGTEIGPYATVGHTAIVHGATVGERALVGMGATVLDDATVGDRSLVAASALVPPGTEVPPESRAAGVPASVETDVEETVWAYAADTYVDLADRHARASERLD